MGAVPKYPDEIRRMRADPDVRFFYPLARAGHGCCAVVRPLGGHAFLITDWPTAAINKVLPTWSICKCSMIESARLSPLGLRNPAMKSFAKKAATK